MEHDHRTGLIYIISDTDNHHSFCPIHDRHRTNRNRDYLLHEESKKLDDTEI